MLYAIFKYLSICPRAPVPYFHIAFVWTLSAMTSKNKNGGDSWGTLHGRPMERMAFRYDRHMHEEIVRYIRMWHVYYHPMVMCVLLTFKKFLAAFVIPDAIEYNLILNMFHKMCIQISSLEA